MNILRLKNFFRIICLGLAPLFISILQSCAKTQIGQELANSFDSPAVDPLADLGSNNAPVDSKKVLGLQSNKLPKRISKLSDRKNNYPLKLARRSDKNKSSKAKTITFKPQPYRITIKLSGANPSAPAETVTKALRVAGISFEVERIERVKDQSQDKVLRTVRTAR